MICKRCGHDKEQTEENFRRQVYIRQSSIYHGPTLVDSWNATCNECQHESHVAARRRLLEKKLAAQPKTLVCSKCGHEKTTKGNFWKSPCGTYRQPCRTCKRIMIADYRKTSKWREWKRRTRKRRLAKERAWNKAHPERPKAAKARYAQKKLTDPEYVKAQKALSILRWEVKRGRAVKPDHCERCKAGPATGTRLMAYQPKGLVDPLFAKWYCPPHHAAVRTELRRRQEQIEDGDPRTPLEALTIDPLEWQEIHERHKALLEHEQGVLENLLGPAPSNDDRRLAFLVGVCEYTHREAREIMSREGRMECVLGHWVPAKASA